MSHAERLAAQVRKGIWDNAEELERIHGSRLTRGELVMLAELIDEYNPTPELNLPSLTS